MKLEFDIEKFTNDIDIYIAKKVSYIDAVVLWCTKNDVELELIASVIKKNPIHKERILLDAKEKHMVKKSNLE